MNDKFSCEEALETDKFVGVDQPFVYDVDYIATDDASSASTLPLYWVKPKPNANDTKVYRFFKLSVESK